MSDVISHHSTSPYFHSSLPVTNMNWVNIARNAWTDLQVLTRSSNPSTLSKPWSPNRFSSSPTLHLQHLLSSEVLSHELSSLLSSVNQRDLIRLRSAAGTGAGAFLSALPDEPGCSFSNSELSHALRFRLGIPLSGIPPPTCFCDRSADSFGDHYMGCNFGGELQARHDFIKQSWSQMFRLSGHTVQVEVPLSAISPDSSDSFRNRRFDILARTGDSSSFSVDVSVVHPTPESGSARNSYARSPGTAASSRESRKRAIYGNISQNLGMAFAPLIMESYGTLGPCAQRVLKTIAKTIAKNQSSVGVANPAIVAQLTDRWRRRLSCSLRRETRGFCRCVHIELQRNATEAPCPPKSTFRNLCKGVFLSEFPQHSQPPRQP